MTLDYLLFDYSEGDDDTGLFEALADVPLPRAEAVPRVLNRSTATSAMKHTSFISALRCVVGSSPINFSAAITCAELETGSNSAAPWMRAANGTPTCRCRTRRADAASTSA